MPRIGLLQRQLHLADSGSSAADDGGGFFDGAFDLARISQITIAGILNAVNEFGQSIYNKVGAGGIASFNDATGLYIQYTSGAGNGTLAGWTSNATTNSFRFDNLPCYVFHFQTGGTVTNVRHWIGFFPATPTGASATGATPADFVVFRHNTVASGDTTWHAVTADAVATGTVTDTGVTVTADTSYYMIVQVVSTSEVRFYLAQSNTLPAPEDMVLVATHTTNLPLGNVAMTPSMGLNNGTSGTGRVIRCGHIRGRYL